MTTIEHRVKKIVAEVLGIEEKDVHDESWLDDDLGADSTDLEEIRMKIEDEFGDIKDEEAELMRSVQHFIYYARGQASKNN
ncbi:acyl carrier protein [Penicillium brevicompactum]|uniref:Acyl carrier protein n=1 Tax=Penicillium brevicompactum TaxID=5074 RepID=A0A9W9Q2N5_PENBR|nr:acyl carrier protein [Penicillium brevicompactum]